MAQTRNGARVSGSHREKQALTMATTRTAVPQESRRPEREDSTPSRVAARAKSNGKNAARRSPPRESRPGTSVNSAPLAESDSTSTNTNAGRPSSTASCRALNGTRY